MATSTKSRAVFNYGEAVADSHSEAVTRLRRSSIVKAAIESACDHLVVTESNFWGDFVSGYVIDSPSYAGGESGERQFTIFLNDGVIEFEEDSISEADGGRIFQTVLDGLDHLDSQRS